MILDIILIICFLVCAYALFLTDKRIDKIKRQLSITEKRLAETEDRLITLEQQWRLKFNCLNERVKVCEQNSHYHID